GHVLLNQHFPRAGHDRRTTGRHLFGPAGALKRHGSKVSDRWALVIRPLVRYSSVVPPIQGDLHGPPPPLSHRSRSVRKVGRRHRLELRARSGLATRLSAGGADVIMAIRNRPKGE